MPLYFFLCLLKNKELRKSLVVIETEDCCYRGYLRGVSESSLEIEVSIQEQTKHIYLLLSKIVSVEVSKVCCKAYGKDTVKCFSEFGLEKQDTYEHHPKYERHLVRQLVKQLKEQEAPGQEVQIILTNGKKVDFKLQELMKTLEEITVIYKQNQIGDENSETIVVLSNEYMSAIELVG